MIDIETVRRMAKEQGIKAAKAKKTPYMWAAEDGIDSLRKLPNIGDHRPKGWQLVEEYFVDSSELGQEGEPALTIGQMLTRMKPGMGYAIIQVGEYQIYIGEFRKEVS